MCWDAPRSDAEGLQRGAGTRMAMMSHALAASKRQGIEANGNRGREILERAQGEEAGSNQRARLRSLEVTVTGTLADCATQLATVVPSVNNTLLSCGPASMPWPTSRMLPSMGARALALLPKENSHLTKRRMLCRRGGKLAW